MGNAKDASQARFSKVMDACAATVDELAAWVGRSHPGWVTLAPVVKVACEDLDHVACRVEVRTASPERNEWIYNFEWVQHRHTKPGDIQATAREVTTRRRFSVGLAERA